MNLDVVICALLPVFWTRGTGGDAGLGRGWPDFFQLAKGVLVELDRVGEGWQGQNEEEEGKLHRE